MPKEFPNYLKGAATAASRQTKPRIDSRNVKPRPITLASRLCEHECCASVGYRIWNGKLFCLNHYEQMEKQ